MKLLWTLSVILVVVAAVNSQCLMKNLLGCAEYLGSYKFNILVGKAHIRKEFSRGRDDKTLLLPSSTALDNLPWSVANQLSRNMTYLRSVLRYHLVPKVLNCGLMGDNTIVDTKQGGQVRFNKYYAILKSMATVEGAQYLDVERKAFNGRVCVIDQLLYNIPSKSIYEYVSTDSALSTFLLLSAKSKTMDTYKEADMTLLIPDNSAFSKLAPGVLQNMTSNEAMLKALISNHMAHTVYYSRGLEFTRHFKAASGKIYTVKGEGPNKYIGSAKVLQSDIPTKNGVVHIIDTVLLDD